QVNGMSPVFDMIGPKSHMRMGLKSWLAGAPKKKPPRPREPGRLFVVASLGQGQVDVDVRAPRVVEAVVGRHVPRREAELDALGQVDAVVLDRDREAAVLADRGDD